jgi:hypothetical protein
MRFITLLSAGFLATSASASPLDVLAARQTNNTEEAYLDSVCFPNTTEPIIPPCQEIINIQSACLPNGTAPLDLLAHAECMCGGSFFEDWVGCLNCDYVHGGRSPQIVSAFNTIITSASNLLCTGTPTAPFASIFSSLSDVVAPSGTDTATTDLYPSQTAISLYYTPSGKQGVGAITGAATAATASVTSTSTSMTVKTTGATTGAGANTGSSSSGGSSSTSSSKAGAAPTGVWMGALGAVAGGVVMAVL